MTTAPPRLPTEPAKPIAPWLHTLGIVLLLVAGATFSHRRATIDVATEPSPRIPRYLTSIALEWVLAGLVLVGIRNRGAFLATAFRNRARGFAQSLGFGLAVYWMGFLAIAIVSAGLLATPLGHRRNEAVIGSIAPHSLAEFAVWFLVALTAGVCEEIVFRGYLQQQLTSWLGRPILAIVLAAALFGSVHLYEGAAAVLPLAALGLVYGLVVRHFKGDLRAVIVAHATQDFLVALILLARPWLLRHQPRP
jgi:membrane protease YdiL (CAAX protease family)